MNLEAFPLLKQWWERILERPAVQKGISVPGVSNNMNRVYQKRLLEESGLKEEAAVLTDLAEKAKKQVSGLAESNFLVVSAYDT